VSNDISNAKDPFLRDSYAALKKAAEFAKEEAIRTNTGIVVLRDGKVVTISAEELRKEKQAKAQDNLSDTDSTE